MRCRHFSAVRTLNGKLSWRGRKWRFSLTRISDPVHSVYAAMNASAGFRPLASYFAPKLKGTKKSSSMIINEFVKRINSRYSAGNRFLLTSSAIVRQIWMRWTGALFKMYLRRFAHTSFLTNPKAEIYSLESSTRSNFFLPELFSGLTQFVDNFFFSHTMKLRRPLRNHFSKFLKMFQRLFSITFSHFSPFGLFFELSRSSHFFCPEVFSYCTKFSDDLFFRFFDHYPSPRIKSTTECVWCQLSAKDHDKGPGKGPDAGGSRISR